MLFDFTDSVENQEGGAMYISCGDDAVAVEAEMGYVPNNPLFGLPLDSPQVNLFHLHTCRRITYLLCKVLTVQNHVKVTGKKRSSFAQFDLWLIQFVSNVK